MGRIWDFGHCKNNSAILDEYGNCITYEMLDEKSKLIFEKIGYRCLVFSLCKNSIGSVIGYVGFLNNGIVPVLLNSNLETGLLCDLIDTYKPDFLWIPKDQASQFSDFRKVYDVYDYTLLSTGHKNYYGIYDELALLLTTSGSTGSPKLVRQSYTNVYENAKSITEYLCLDSTERPISTLPMNYTYGLSIINSHLMVGATLLLTDKTLMQKEFWRFFKEANTTSFGGVPYTYEMLDRLRFYRMQLPSLRYMTQAGGKILPELHEKFARFASENNKKFIVMYGQCEATARMGYLPHEYSVEKKGSMGIAIPGGRFYLIDDADKEIDLPFTPGELVYEGKNVTLGYAECGSDLKLGDERHGVLRTGDIAQFDEEGFYYIVGRKKRFLKIFGNRVNLDEVDRLIKSEFSIDATSSGVDDKLYIFLTSDRYAEQVRDYIIKKTKLNPLAFKVKVIDSIPKNESGKILYKELSKYYE